MKNKNIAYDICSAPTEWTLREVFLCAKETGLYFYQSQQEGYVAKGPYFLDDTENMSLFIDVSTPKGLEKFNNYNKERDGR